MSIIYPTLDTSSRDSLLLHEPSPKTDRELAGLPDALQ